MNTTIKITACAAFLTLTGAATALANDNVVWRSQIKDAGEIDTAKDVVVSDRVLKKEQLPDYVISTLGIPPGTMENVGSGGIPFTTQGAGDDGGGDMVSKFPWRATGKLYMAMDGGVGACTASVIGKSLLVTAAHCVHDFGQGDSGFVRGIVFQPARYDGEKPHGTWLAKEWWIPKAYHDGTDDCDAKAPGIVCANDVAVVVLEKFDGKSIAEVTGKYNLPPEQNEDNKNEYGYFKFLSVLAVQLTQLGYPANGYGGLRMIRTDSLGYQVEQASNLVFGSGQTNGSSGGPVMQNFGTPTDFSGPPGFFPQINTVSAVTSWGYGDKSVKVQGASRFAKNKIYTSKSNIGSLVDSVCKTNPDAC